MGQISVQAIGLITGLLLIRLLAVDQYARFGVAFAFQSTIAMLVDVGFSNSIVALVGHRGSEPEVIGGYIRSAQHYRNRMFVFIGICALVAFPLVTQRQPWGAGAKAAAARRHSRFRLPSAADDVRFGLLIHRRLTPYYSAQLISAVTRLCCALILARLGLLTAVAAAWLTTLTIGLNGSLYRFWAAPLVREPRISDKTFNRDMLKFVTPLIPGIVFYAFQGQIAVGIITIFGKSKNIAEVSALGRLGQLFVVLGAVNTVLIEPHIARLSAALLRRRYAFFALSAWRWRRS